jgi:hypothetical protein
VLKARHLLGESFRQRANRFVFGFLEQLTLIPQDAIDRFEQARLLLSVERQRSPDPLAQIGRRARDLVRWCRRTVSTGWRDKLGHTHQRSTDESSHVPDFAEMVELIDAPTQQKMDQ